MERQVTATRLHGQLDAILKSGDDELIRATATILYYLSIKVDIPPSSA